GRGQVLLGRHPDVDAFLPFRKRALFAADGPLRTPFFLRKQSYSVAIDASNPTDPSLTQAFFTATSGARYTIGSAARGCAPFFSHPVEPDSADIHEIEHRLNLLEPLPGDARVRMPSLAYDDRGVDADEPYVVINVGARVASKQLSVDEFVRLADVCSRSHPVVLTWGPGEHALAAAVAERCAGALVAPPTSLDELAVLLKDAYAVVSCDTGPMHLAVALGTPTLGIFLTTSPRRYGYTDVPHAVFDGRGGREGLTGTVCGWLARERVA
ncbi:MAG: glycosyltransferase family 9 protein, partial [Myxococcota bacterium]